jgi:hypothetical protein
MFLFSGTFPLRMCSYSFKNYFKENQKNLVKCEYKESKGERFVRRILLFLCLSIGSFFAFQALGNEISHIEQSQPELFGFEVEPYKVEEDLNHVQDGRGGYIEQDITYYYTDEDQAILDERERTLGMLPLLRDICRILAIGGVVVFIVCLYLKVSDMLDERRKKSNQVNYQTVRQYEEERNQNNQKFIEKVKNIIHKHENSGTVMSNQEISDLYAELDKTNKSYQTRIKVEHMIKQHRTSFNG